MAKVTISGTGKAKKRRVSDDVLPSFIDQEWRKPQVEKITITR